jgi:hypothetical protein
MHPTAAWLVGLLAGLVGMLVAALAPTVGVPVLALIALVLVLRGPRAAIGGGMLLATGLWFSYFHFSMIARCEAMNTASGSCTVVDANGTLLPALTFVAAGAALSVYALGNARSAASRIRTPTR